MTTTERQDAPHSFPQRPPVPQRPAVRVVQAKPKVSLDVNYFLINLRETKAKVDKLFAAHEERTQKFMDDCNEFMNDVRDAMFETQ